MASFDIVCRTDMQKLDNSVNSTLREIKNRFDFYESQATVEMDSTAQFVYVSTENEMRLNTVLSILISRMVKQGLEASSLDFSKPSYLSGKMIKKKIKIKEGIDKDTARKIVSTVKGTGLKVQAAIMDDKIRVNGKQIDDLQKAISVVKSTNYGLPLQFENLKR